MFSENKPLHDDLTNLKKAIGDNSKCSSRWFNGFDLKKTVSEFMVLNDSITIEDGHIQIEFQNMNQRFIDLKPDDFNKIEACFKRLKAAAIELNLWRD
jgi:hypothetical protein